MCKVGFVWVYVCLCKVGFGHVILVYKVGFGCVILEYSVFFGNIVCLVYLIVKVTWMSVHQKATCKFLKCCEIQFLIFIFKSTEGKELRPVKCFVKDFNISKIVQVRVTGMP